MSKLQIKSIFGNVIYECEALSAKKCLEFAVKDITDLSGANLSGAYLGNANLSGANLRGANLSGADLGGAYLGDANLGGADLKNADLSGVNLCCADLSGAYLRNANLSGANLSGADLCCANLGGAYLRNAYLRNANLSGAYLGGAIKIKNSPIQILTPVYHVTIWDSHMQIGCEFHSLSDWFNFKNKRILEMDDRRALNWWKVWKQPLQSICEANGRS